MKYLILGAKGNLGTQLQKVLPNSIGLDKEDLDVTDKNDLVKKIKASAADVVINCVAYNDVDGAEENREIAHKLNVEVPREIATSCQKLGIIFLHFSTGYVFSGQKKHYNENDAPDPISEYGKSKFEGEKNVLQIAKKVYVIRTNLLFGPLGESSLSKRSVVDVLKTVGQEKRHLKGITDEFASFTYTKDLAMAVKNLLLIQPDYGIYHLTNEGSGSWHDLAAQIFHILGYNVIVESRENLKPKEIIIEKVKASDYYRKAIRPKNSVLNNNKLPKLRKWQSALEEYLNE